MKISFSNKKKRKKKLFLLSGSFSVKFSSLYGLILGAIITIELLLLLIMGVIACCSCEGLVQIWFMVSFLFCVAIGGDFHNNWLVFIIDS